MRILHIVAGLTPGGGIAETVPNLCRHLRQLGHEVTLATLDGPMGGTAAAAEAAGVRLVRYRPTGLRPLWFSWPMLRRLRRLCAEADVVHVHSQWTFPVWWGCRCALRENKPLVMSPRGCLDPVRLRHAVCKKRLVGWIDRWCLLRADVVHATSEREREWVEGWSGEEERGSSAAGAAGSRFKRPDGLVQSSSGEGKTRRIVVIPNGVDVEDFSRQDAKTPSEMEPWNPETSAKRNGTLKPSSPRTVLYLGRLHPLKGLELLISAWAEIKGSTAADAAGFRVQKGSKGKSELLAWKLVIAGPDEQGTLRALKEQAERLGLSFEDKCVNALMRECVNEGDRNKAIKHSGNNATFSDIFFTGPVYGEEKERLMAGADLVVLPSRSENFGVVVAEALARGVPVITTKGTPWQELHGEGSNAADAAGSNAADAAGLIRFNRPRCGLVQKGSNARVAGWFKRFKRDWCRWFNPPLPCGLRRTSRHDGLVQGVANENNHSSFIPHPSSFSVNGRCGWWIDVGVEPLVEALREAMGMSDEERRAMGENGRRLVERKYRWEAVAEQMSAVYSGFHRG